MHARFLQTKIVKEGRRIGQLVSSFDKCHYVMQACKKKKKKKEKEKRKK
jgi:hypothetical protein